MAEIKQKEFKVLKPFVAEKSYKIGDLIALSDKKTIDKLISNKFIK
jgi:hypothetical protein